MSGSIDFRIEVEDNGGVALRLDQFPEQLRARLRTVITQLTNELLSAVEAAEPVRTGRLRQATHAYVDEMKSGGIRGRVRVLRDSGLGPRFGALEYGAPGGKRHGPVKVRAYRRGSGSVHAYERRRPHIRAMRFLRGPALARQARARDLIRAAVENAWTGGRPA